VKEHLGYEGGPRPTRCRGDESLRNSTGSVSRYADANLRNRLIQAVQQIDAKPIADLMGSS